MATIGQAASTMTIITGAIERWVSASCWNLLLVRVRINLRDIPAMTLTAKLGTREKSSCSIINNLEIIWHCGVMVRVSSKKTVLQAILVGQVKASPELLIIVICREFTFAHKRASNSEKFVVIMTEIASRAHVRLGRFTDKLAKMLFCVSMHLGVIRIQHSQFFFEGVPGQRGIAILIAPKVVKVKWDIPDNIFGFLFVGQVMGLHEIVIFCQKFLEITRFAREKWRLV